MASVIPTAMAGVSGCLTTLFRQSRVIAEPVPDILSIDIQSTFWEVFDGEFCSG